MNTQASASRAPKTLVDMDGSETARSGNSPRERTALEDSQRALLNILEDFTTEKGDLERGQQAVLNILEDFDAEKARLEGAQRAVLNILEDSTSERMQLEAAQRAVLNILDDFAAETTQTASTQRAVLNILDDFAGEKTRLQETQRAALNILEDFDLEKAKVEQVNQDLEREIQERKHIEEEIKRVNSELTSSNKELEAFSYSVSHDLRTPLRGIDGFSQALLEDYPDQLDERGKDYLHRVRAATQRMGALIDDLLKLSRMTRMEIQKRRVNISALALSVAAELKKMQPERDVEFVITPGLEVMADSRLLRAVLENLIGNAWKFSSAHSRAKIEIGQAQHNGARAFFVRDDGAGFDPDHANRLFGAFQRLHTASEFPGTGIGLATVQRIVQRHGGRVWAEAAIERGATFYFTLNAS